MAKFVVLAREAFTDLVRGLGSKGSGFGPDVQRMFRSYQENRSRIASHYKKAAGKVVPEGKVVVPSELHRALKQENFVKKHSQATAKSMGDEKLFKKGPGRHQQPKRGQMIPKGSINRRLEGPNTRIERYGGTREEGLKELDRKRIEERDVARNREIPDWLSAYRSAAPQRLNRTKYKKRKEDY